MDETMQDDELEQFKQLLRAQGFSDADLASFTPDQLAAMYADYAGEEALITEQRRQAEAMRDATQRDLGGTMAGGRVFVADSPLETIASIGGDVVNAMQQRKLNEQQEGVNTRRAQGQQDMARLYAMGAGRDTYGDPRARMMRSGNSDEDTWEEERRRLFGY